MYSIGKTNGIEQGIEELDKLYPSVSSIIEKNDCKYLVDSVRNVFDVIHKDVLSETDKKTVIKANAVYPLKAVDIKMTTSDLLISNNPQVCLYPKKANLNLIKGILLGDPLDDVELNLSNEYLREGFLTSDTGNITINYMNVDNLDISTNTGDVILRDVKAKYVSITANTGEVIIKGSKIGQLVITTSTGDILVDSNSIDNIKTNSDIGDIKIISSTNNVNCKTLGMKTLLNNDM